MIGSFRSLYGGAEGVRVWRAPGRVNLIGEHTDYNLGFVLPIALDKACYVAAAPNADGKLRIYSEQRREMCEWPVENVAGLAPARHWTDYAVGVAQELMRAGYTLAPANLLIRSTVPEGGGLSSSAALEVSSALALLAGRAVDGLDLARLCLRAERDFVGLPCGIMDQYIAVFGREHAAIRIDCRSQESQAVALPEGGTFLAVNTMVKHALAGSAYRERTQQCAAAVAGLRRRHSGVESLRDVTPEQFDPLADTLPDVVARRALHIITENARVELFIAAAARGDLRAMGKLFVESHRSLQYDYEVSCAELDFLVDTALSIPGVYGARMTGGGFGGCTVNLLSPEAAEGFRARIVEAYERKFRVAPQIYECRPSAGAMEVNNFETIPPAP
jgi:galactokinase